MRRCVVLAIIMILFGQFVLVLMPQTNVIAEEFRLNVRVDSNVGSGTIRSSPSIASDNGNIYIVWQDNRDGWSDIYYSRSNNQGASFLRDVRVNDNPIGDGTYQMNPDVAAEDGTIYVVWEDGRAGIGTQEIYFAVSTDGLVFESSIKVSDGGTEERYPSVAVDRVTGNIYVVWASQEKTIRLARSIDGGQSFESSILVSGSTLYGRSHPSIDVDSSGKVYVAWSDGRLGIPPFWVDYYDVFIASSSNGGLSFGANTPVNEVDTDAVQMRPSISIDGDDVVHVSWEDERRGSRDIFYSKSTDGSTFGPDVIVNDPYVHPRNPSITHQTSSISVHESGSPIFVVWTDDRAVGHNVYLVKSTDGGSSFQTATSDEGGNYFFDSNITFNGGWNSNEAVILDDGNGILDPGTLNGVDSPDKIVVPGQANLEEDLAGYRIRYCDINGNQIWDPEEDIMMDGRVILYPRVQPTRKNAQDTTTGNFPSYLRWDLRNGDSMYYTTEKDERMVVGWFDPANAKDESLNPIYEGLMPGDPISGVEIEIAYKTDAGYDGTNDLTWSEALALEKPILKVQDTGGVEVYERVDLFALGVDSVEKLETLNMSFINDASSQYNVSFNSMFLAIERGLPDGYDDYDFTVYDGSAIPPLNSPLTVFSDSDDLMFIDGSGNGLYDRGEPLIMSSEDADPGSPINESFTVLERGDNSHWNAVFEPFPLNDDLDNSHQELPDVAIDDAGDPFIVWRDRRHWPLSDSIYLATSSVDLVQPEVLDCYPSKGAQEVPLDATFSFTLSEPMQPDTTSHVNITPQTYGHWFWNWDKTILTFVPDPALMDNITYSFTLYGGRDRSGNQLKSPFSCLFRTVEGPAISHDIPQDPLTVDEPVGITAVISDNDTVTGATIFYKNIGEINFSQTPMSLESGSSVLGTWGGQIPAQPFMGFVVYYIVALDATGNTGRSPRSGEHLILIGDTVPPTLNHSAISSASAGSTVTFSATAWDNIGVFTVKLYLKPLGSSRFNPPVDMKRVGDTSEFRTALRMPNENGNLYYYIEVTDEWGNVVSSGDPSSPHKISIIDASADIGAVAIWGALFAIIGLLYLGLFILYRRPAVEEDEEVGEEESPEEESPEEEAEEEEEPEEEEAPDEEEAEEEPPDEEELQAKMIRVGEE